MNQTYHYSVFDLLGQRHWHGKFENLLLANHFQWIVAERAQNARPVVAVTGYQATLYEKLISI